MTSLYEPAAFQDVRHVQRRAATTRRSFYVLWLGVTLVLAVIGYTTAPRTMVLPLGILIIGGVAILLRPVVGVYLIIFFGAMGDSVTASWYPFTKNLSSRESVLFLADALSFNPAEIFLALTLFAWLASMAGSRVWRIWRGPIFWPVIAFTAFALYAAARGISAGGDTTVALFELRPMLLFGGLYVVATNLLTTLRQWRGVIWLVMIALTVNSILSIGFVRSLSAEERDTIESLVEHPAAVQMNLMFAVLIAAMLFRGSAKAYRRLLPVMAAPVVYVYLLSQRRAAFVGLVAVAVIAATVLFWRRRRLFWMVVPACVMVGAAYVLAFWNVEGGAGFPAQAVKSVIAPEQLSETDQASDVYRVLENIDLLFTIKTNPVRGIGFGVPFYRPVQLPEIGRAFEYFEYIPHNSVMAIWMKMGVGGFFALLALFGIAVRTGSRALRELHADDAVLAFAATSYVIMFATYAYVDIAWDTRSMVYLGAMMALLTTLARTSSAPPPEADGR